MEEDGADELAYKQFFQRQIRGITPANTKTREIRDSTEVRVNNPSKKCYSRP